MVKLRTIFKFISPVVCFCSYIRPQQGFSSVTQEVAEALCFNYRNISSSSFQGSIQYDSSFTTEEISKMLKIDVSIKAGFGPFGIEATSSYLRSKEDKLLSLSVHYLAKYWRNIDIDHAFQVNETLTQEGMDILAIGQDQFRIHCGDHYITSYEEGAMLIYTVTFTFSTQSEKKLFQDTLKADFGFASASVSYTDLIQKLKVQGTLSVSAHQIGGNPTLLSTALTAPVAFTDLAGCQAVLEGLHNYSLNFAQQIENENLGAEPLGTLQTLGPYTTSSMFSSTQIDLGKGPVTAEINKAREWLTLIKKDLEEDLANLEMLKEQGFSRVSAGIEEEIEIVKHNLRLLETGLIQGPMRGCWYNIDYCLAIATEIKENLLPSKFDPKTDLKLCNHPSKHGLNAHELCKKSSHYSSGGRWIDGIYTDEIRIPPEGGNCNAVAFGDFKRKKKFGGFKVGWYRWSKVCSGEATYSPQPDPENEYDWKKDRPERIWPF